MTKRYLATNYGERFAQVIKDHLKWACDACYIGLYRGEIGGSLARVLYQPALTLTYPCHGRPTGRAEGPPEDRLRPIGANLRKFAAG